MSLMQEIVTLKPTHGDTKRANTPEQRQTRPPNMSDLMDLGVVTAGVYELTTKEIKTVRSRVYALNKHNTFGWRWRTLVEPAHGKSRTQLLLVWRIH